MQIKFKENIDIFSMMSTGDWREVSSYREDGIMHLELGEIMALIVEK